MVMQKGFQILEFFSELNIDSFDFSNGFRCSDVYKFEKLNNLSINIFELSFHSDQKTWKQKLTPIEISKYISDRVVDLLIKKIIILSLKN